MLLHLVQSIRVRNILCPANKDKILFYLFPGGRRPKGASDPIEVFKKFVVDCYENQLFKSSTPFQPRGMNSYKYQKCP